MGREEVLSFSHVSIFIKSYQHSVLQFCNGTMSSFQDHLRLQISQLVCNISSSIHMYLIQIHVLKHTYIEPNTLSSEKCSHFSSILLLSFKSLQQNLKGKSWKKCLAEEDHTTENWKLNNTKPTWSILGSHALSEGQGKTVNAVLTLIGKGKHSYHSKLKNHCQKSLDL